MRILDFGPEQGRRVTHYGSDFTISRLVHTQGMRTDCIRTEPGGVVGYHQAGNHQLFAVVQSEGWTRGEGEERIGIVAGQAVYWQSGEWHETGTSVGLVAIVVEGEVLGGVPDGIGPMRPGGG